jgi:hypothetical protein
MAVGEETALSSLVFARSASGKLAGKYRLQAGELYSMDVMLPTAQRPRLLLEHAAVCASDPGAREDDGRNAVGWLRRIGILVGVRNVAGECEHIAGL